MENKYKCPNCGAEMIAVYEKPAINLTYLKCAHKIATTKRLYKLLINPVII